MDYICTYFYQEKAGFKSAYGNITADNEEKNRVYWKTVYVMFRSALKSNPNCKLILFTNIDDFIYRNEIEGLGVDIISDLEITRINEGKWASVKFVFDVIERIEFGIDFNDEDKFLLLDTDCIIQGSLGTLFKELDGEIVAYKQPGVFEPSYKLHGIPFSSLDSLYQKTYGYPIKSRERIGGEFYAFKKKAISGYSKKISKLIDIDSPITTEEQVWSMHHADIGYYVNHKYIYRVWSSIRYQDIPQDFKDYSILHLPSEKESGISGIFEELINKETFDLSEVIDKHLTLENKKKLLLRKIYFLIRKKIGLI
ncbi:conserved hypothetical protein [Vibrio chagasii]|nr:conserved hypothetical protein [Vibrio chagasii]